MNKKLAVVGLGKLGLCSALCFAKAKFDVIGYDISKSNLENISKKKFDNYEKDVVKYLKLYRRNYLFTNNLDEILKQKTIFVIVPTPSRKDYSFSNDYINQFLKEFTNLLIKTKKKKINSTLLFVPQLCLGVVLNL